MYAGHSAGRHRLTLAAFREPDLFRASCRRTSRSSGVSRLLCSSSSSSSSVPARHGAFTTSPKNVAAIVPQPRAVRPRLRAGLQSRPLQTTPPPRLRSRLRPRPGRKPQSFRSVARTVPRRASVTLLTRHTAPGLHPAALLQGPTGGGNPELRVKQTGPMTASGSREPE